MARAGDVVLIAGKGHETGQDFGDHVEAFDDAEVARHALRTWRRSGSPTTSSGVDGASARDSSAAARR